jgi:hypothetical protein
MSAKDRCTSSRGRLNPLNRWWSPAHRLIPATTPRATGITLIIKPLQYGKKIARNAILLLPDNCVYAKMLRDVSIIGRVKYVILAMSPGG